MKALEQIRSFLGSYRNVAYAFFHGFLEHERPFWLRTDFTQYYMDFIEQEGKDGWADNLEEVLPQIQELAVNSPWLMMALRPRNGEWEYLQLHAEALECQEVTPSEFLSFKERLVTNSPAGEEWLLELDMEPFNREFPHLRESDSIGQGVQFLNRYLSSRLIPKWATATTCSFNSCGSTSTVTTSS